MQSMDLPAGSPGEAAGPHSGTLSIKFRYNFSPPRFRLPLVATLAQSSEGPAGVPRALGTCPSLEATCRWTPGALWKDHPEMSPGPLQGTLHPPFLPQPKECRGPTDTSQGTELLSLSHGRLFQVLVKHLLSHLPPTHSGLDRS